MTDAQGRPVQSDRIPEMPQAEIYASDPDAPLHNPWLVVLGTSWLVIVVVAIIVGATTASAFNDIDTLDPTPAGMVEVTQLLTAMGICLTSALVATFVYLGVLAVLWKPKVS